MFSPLQREMADVAQQPEEASVRAPEAIWRSRVLPGLYSPVNVEETESNTGLFRIVGCVRPNTVIPDKFRTLPSAPPVSDPPRTRRDPLLTDRGALHLLWVFLRALQEEESHGGEERVCVCASRRVCASACVAACVCEEVSRINRA